MTLVPHCPRLMPATAALVIGLGLILTPLQAPAESNANALLVEAVQAQRAAPAAEVDPAGRVEALKAVLAVMDRIVAEHPSSDLAVQIITDQPIGTLDAAAIRAEIAALESQIAAAAAASAAEKEAAAAAEAEAARQAGLPLLERDLPVVRVTEDLTPCVSAYECRLQFAYKVATQVRGQRGSSMTAIMRGVWLGAYLRSQDRDADIALDRLTTRPFLDAQGLGWDMWEVYGVVAGRDGAPAAAAVMRAVSDRLEGGALEDYETELLRAFGAYLEQNGTAKALDMADAMEAAGFDVTRARDEIETYRRVAAEEIEKRGWNDVDLTTLEGNPLFTARRFMRVLDHPRLTEAREAALAMDMADNGDADPGDIMLMIRKGALEEATATIQSAMDNVMSEGRIEMLDARDLYKLMLLVAETNDATLSAVMAEAVLPVTLNGEVQYLKDVRRQSFSRSIGIPLMGAGLISLGLSG
ncbi:MAG: hypothetical protein AAFR52_19210 [Pseudomonadota bacterium]